MSETRFLCTFLICFELSLLVPLSNLSLELFRPLFLKHLFFWAGVSSGWLSTVADNTDLVVKMLLGHFRLDQLGYRWLHHRLLLILLRLLVVLSILWVFLDLRIVLLFIDWLWFWRTNHLLRLLISTIWLKSSIVCSEFFKLRSWDYIGCRLCNWHSSWLLRLGLFLNRLALSFCGFLRTDTWRLLFHFF